MPQLVPSLTIRIAVEDGQFQATLEQVKHFAFSPESSRFFQVKGNSVDQVQDSLKATIKKLQMGKKLPKQLGLSFVISVHDLGKNLQNVS